MQAFLMTLGFGPSSDPAYPELVRRAQAMAGYRAGGELEPFEHAVENAPGKADEMLGLYRSARALGPVTVLVNRQKLPYGEELWLPLMWFFLEAYRGPIPFKEASS
ncbi:MAG TPA: hypothetical protein VGB99_10195 [Acidobacteriota bacterium]